MNRNKWWTLAVLVLLTAVYCVMRFVLKLRIKSNINANPLNPLAGSITFSVEPEEKKKPKTAD